MRPDNLLAVVRASSRACEITEWRRVALHAIPLVILFVGLFYYWFVVADRRMVFLYDHLGATPFDGVTSSRYWMSALVASGFVLVVHVPALWILGRMGARGLRPYRPPPWWQIWIACAMPVSLALPVIVVAIGKPALSLELAAACLVASWVGLALALAPGHLAAKRPSELVWLAWDGLGLMPVLTLLRVVELPGKGLSIPDDVAYLVAGGSVLAGIAWLGLMTGLRLWRRKPACEAVPLLVAGGCISYLLGPLAHHLLLTPPGYRYISAASNIFASDLSLQLLTFAVAALIAAGATTLRRRLATRFGGG